MDDLFSLVSFAVEHLCKAVQSIILFSDTLFMITVRGCFIFLTINSYRIPKNEYILLSLLTYTSSYVGGEHSDAPYFWKQCLESLV